MLVSCKFIFLFVFGSLGFLVECQLTANCSANCAVRGSGRALQCWIDSDDTEFLSTQLFPCAAGDYRTLSVSLSHATIGATLNIALPSNILKLVIHSFGIAVETSLINSNLLTLLFHCDSLKLQHGDFFSYFPSLRRLHAIHLQTEYLPHFSLNKDLELLNVHHYHLSNETGREITEAFVGGLGQLSLLHWTDGDVSGIASGAFVGATSLSQMSLKNNKITELVDFAFEGLDNLLELSLSGNNITAAGGSAFEGLESLTTIRLNRNPDFPVSSLHPLRGLGDISMDDLSAVSFPFSTFQQFPRLETLRIRDARLHCDCGTEWLAALASFGIQLDSTGACCVSPVPAIGSLVTDPSLYVSCPNRTYHCFNKSIECQGADWFRVDSNETCNCTCPAPHIGYLYDASALHVGCLDIDECLDSLCEGLCVNTVGSYMCACAEGYALAGQFSCGDVDECTVGNGNCAHNCSNSIGSFSCSCAEGYSVVNSSQCSEAAAVGSPFSSFNQTQFYLVLLFGLICLCFAVVLFILLICVCVYSRRKRGYNLPKPRVEALPTARGDMEMSVEKNRDSSVDTGKETGASVQKSGETIFSNNNSN